MFRVVPTNTFSQDHIEPWKHQRMPCFLSAHSTDSSPPDFPSFLDELLPWETLAFEFSATVQCIALCNSTALVGLSTGKVVHFSAKLIEFDEGHTGAVLCLAVTPDGKTCVSGGEDSTLRLWTVEKRKTTAVFQAHEKGVTSVCIAAEEPFVISSSRDNSIRVWNLDTAMLVATFIGHSSEVLCVSLAFEENYCVSGSADHTIRLWKISDRSEVATLTGHMGPVLCIAVNSEGNVCFSGSADETIRIWDLENYTQIGNVASLMSEVHSIAVAPNGAFWLSAANDGILNMWESSEPRLIQTLKRHSESLTCVAVTLDNRFCVCGTVDNSVLVVSLEARSDVIEIRKEAVGESIAITADGELCIAGGERDIEVWDVREKRIVREVEGRVGKVKGVAVTKDGSVCATIGDDLGVTLWDTQGWSEKGSLSGHLKDIFCIAITPDGRNLISGSADTTVKVWSLDTYQEIATFKGHSSWVSSLSVSSDSKYCVSGSWDSSLKLWSLESLSEVCTFLGHTSIVRCVAIAASGKWFISGGDDKTLRLWHTDTRKLTGLLQGHTNRVTAVAINSDDRFVVSGSWDNKVKIWSVEEMNEVATLLGHTGYVTCLSITPTDTYIISQGTDFSIRFWTFEPKRSVTKLANQSRDIRAIAVSKDGKYCYTASSEKTVKVWSLTDMKEKGTLKGHSDSVVCVVLSSNGRFLVTATAESEIKLWDSVTLQAKSSFKSNTVCLHCVAVTGDDKLLLIAGKENYIQIISLETHKEIGTLIGHTKEIRCISSVPDGYYCASGSMDHSIIIWDYSTLSQTNKLLGQSDSVRCVSISPDSKLCISGSYDKTIRVWDIQTAVCTVCLSGHTRLVTTIDVSPSGDYCFSGSSDSTVKIWAIAEGREIETFAGHNSAVSSVKVTPNGRFCVSGGFDGAITVRDLADVNQYALSLPEDIPIESHCFFVSNIDRWKSGEETSKHAQLRTVIPHRVNCLHILAYYNHDLRCRESLKIGVSIVRGKFGSPLTIALERKTTKCIDALLSHFAELILNTENDSAWSDFLAISDDIPAILASDSVAVYPFIKSLITRPAYPVLPEFICPRSPLPLTIYVSNRMINISDFDISDENHIATEIVTFEICLIRWNYAFGSNDSVRLLRLLRKCSNRKVLKSPFVRTLLEDKWRKLSPITLSLTLLYSLLLVNLVMIVYKYWDLAILSSIFFVLNSFFLIYECLQLIALRFAYFHEFWNTVDLTRGILCLFWSISVQSDDENRDLTLSVVILSFLRGFTYFRSFRMTRVFVFLTIQVCKEVYHFLLILGFSVFSFGLMSSVLSEDEQVTISWTSAFRLLMGDFDITGFRAMEWLVFMSANVVNVVILLNLLIAILSDAYEKAQMSMKENDYFEMLEVVLELETMMSWRRKVGKRTVMAACKSGKEMIEEKEWTGKVVEITKAIRKDSRRIEEKVDKLGGLEERFEGLEGKLEAKIGGIDRKIGEMEGEMRTIGEQLNTIVSLLRSKQ